MAFSREALTGLLPEKDVLLLEKRERQLAELSSRLVQSPATGRNFEVVIDGESSDLNFSLVKEGESFCFNSLLPSGYRLVDGEKYEVYWMRKEVLFPVKHSPYRGIIVSVLHEIGHARSSVFQHSIDPVSWSLVRFYELVKRSYAQTAVKVEWLKDRSETLYAPSWYVKRQGTKRLILEMEAWIFSIQTMIDLQKNRGFNVFAGFNIDELSQYLTYCLGTYQTRAGMDLLWVDVLDTILARGLPFWMKPFVGPGVNRHIE